MQNDKTAALVIVTFTILLLLGSFLSNRAHGQAMASKKPFLNTEPLQKKESIISKMSGLPSLILAQKNGLNEIKGKNITAFNVNATASASSSNLTEFTKENATALAAKNATGFATRVPERVIHSSPVINENGPSIAAHPTRSDLVLAASQTDDNSGSISCVVYRSTNTGAAWRGPISLPLLRPGDQCSHAVVRWAPADGASPHDPNSQMRAYVVYMSIRGDSSTSDIVVSHSDDGGLAWSSL
jgi:hypothetical protein